MQLKIGIHSRTIFLTILYLPITCATFNELKLIMELNNFFNFDHNIFLLHSSVDINRFINGTRSSEYTTPQSLYVFESADEDNDYGIKMNEITSKNTFIIVVPASASFEINLNLLIRLKEIQVLQVNMKIGIFFLHIVSREDLQKLFEWSWKQRIVNIFAVTHSHPKVVQGLNRDFSLNIFTFNPFETFDVIDVTESESYDNFFLSQDSNFRNFSFRLNFTFFEDLDENVMLGLFSVLNASFVVQNGDVNESISETQINVNEIFIVPRPSVASDGDRHNLYPMERESMVIIVPQALPYSQFGAYLQAIATHSLLCYSFTSIAVIIMFLSLFRYKRRRKILFFQSAADVANLLLNDNGYVKYQQLFDIEILIIVPLTFAGLIIVNGTLSALQSYLTRPINQPQIDTIEDLYQSSFCIYTWGEYWEVQVTDVLTNHMEHGNWTDRVRLMDVESLFNEVEMYNRSMAFLRDQESMMIPLKIQKQLKIRGYHISHIRVSTELFSYAVNYDFPFVERVNTILHRMFDSGLFHLYQRKNYATYEHSILKKNLELLKNRDEIDIERFPIPIFIVYGWVAGLIVMFIEILFKKFTHLQILLNKIRCFQTITLERSYGDDFL